MDEYLLKIIENIVTKGEIAYHEQFLLLLQGFLNSTAAETKGMYILYRKGFIYLQPRYSIIKLSFIVNFLTFQSRHLQIVFVCGK